MIELDQSSTMIGIWDYIAPCLLFIFSMVNAAII